MSLKSQLLVKDPHAGSTESRSFHAALLGGRVYRLGFKMEDTTASKLHHSLQLTHVCYGSLGKLTVKGGWFAARTGSHGKPDT